MDCNFRVINSAKQTEIFVDMVKISQVYRP